MRPVLASVPSTPHLSSTPTFGYLSALSSAPEVFQRKNFELFGDIPNVHIVFDDVIIDTSDDVEHKTALREVFDRARRFNVCFNKEKLRIKMPSVRYLGHVLSADGMKPDPDKIRTINDMQRRPTRNHCSVSSAWCSFSVVGCPTSLT
jgi:hypothetical protein